MSNEIAAAYKSVFEFNDIAGNFKHVDEESIDNQLSFLFSEVEELITGFENRDAPNVLQEACDVLVVTFGLLQKLSVAGFDVATAMKRVNDSNMSKFVPKGKPLAYDANFHSVFNEKYQVSVIKDENSKVRKPKSFVPVNVDDCVPPNFFKEV